jgi:hypothetical protein
MNAGRNMYAALKGSRSSAFSVLPLTRAHIVRPRLVLSVPVAETKMNVMPELRRTRVCATAMVMS